MNHKTATSCFREVTEWRLECPMQNTTEKSPRLTFLQVYYCIYSHLICLSTWICVCLWNTCISDACKDPTPQKRLRFPKVEIIDCCDLSWVLRPKTGFSAKATISFQWATVSSAPLLIFLKMIGTKHKSVEMSVSVKDLLVFKRNSEWPSVIFENMQESYNLKPRNLPFCQNINLSFYNINQYTPYRCWLSVMKIRSNFDCLFRWYLYC